MIFVVVSPLANSTRTGEPDFAKSEARESINPDYDAWGGVFWNWGSHGEVVFGGGLVCWGGIGGWGSFPIFGINNFQQPSGEGNCLQEGIVPCKARMVDWYSLYEHWVPSMEATEMSLDFRIVSVNHGWFIRQLYGYSVLYLNFQFEGNKNPISDTYETNIWWVHAWIVDFFRTPPQSHRFPCCKLPYLDRSRTSDVVPYPWSLIVALCWFIHPFW